jgi:hypothetical protein
LRDEINQSDAIGSGVLDVVRQGGGTLGGKLMRGRVPVHIMRASESLKSGANDPRDGCYWILEHCDEDEKQSDKQTKKNNNTINSEEPKESEQHKGPRIYLDDNDPEFDDFDEEDDIDDDLDL